MVLINDGDGVFTDEAESRGIVYRETDSNPTLFDGDNDGDLDLFITAVYPSRDSSYYENDGTGVFTLRNYESGLVVQNGWGAAAADPDQDGDQDMLAYGLYRNHQANGNHWLEVRAVGGAGSGGLSNRSAIGAIVEVTAAGAAQLRQVQGGTGTSNQDSFAQHFGLGAEALVDSLTVSFPGGATVELTDVAADQLIWVFEDGSSATGWAPPAL
jgi:hypothetical protein